MSNTYEINDRNEVVPYTNGRRCNDTRAWREATELELQQIDQLQQLERELAKVTKQRDAFRDELSKVMPPDYKDWWENDKNEWPIVARLTIENKRRLIDIDQETIERLELELAEVTKQLHLAVGLLSTMPQFENQHPEDILISLKGGQP